MKRFCFPLFVLISASIGLSCGLHDLAVMPADSRDAWIPAIVGAIFMIMAGALFLWAIVIDMANLSWHVEGHELLSRILGALMIIMAALEWYGFRPHIPDLQIACGALIGPLLLILASTTTTQIDFVLLTVETVERTIRSPICKTCRLLGCNRQLREGQYMIVKSTYPDSNVMQIQEVCHDCANGLRINTQYKFKSLRS
ncbi:MAG TPA: hypothetical protein VEA59_02755 [Patescibacteria group bacterium]|nr:hypothetical protein [Patescibacteria group bacterium]